MKPAIGTGFNYTIPFARVIPLIRQAGFEVADLGARPGHSGYDTADGRACIRKLIAENGLRLNSVHAPFPEGDQIFSLDEPKRMDSILQCKMAIDAARDLGARVVVVHPDKGSPDAGIQSKIIAQGVKSIGELSRHALDRGIKVAVENTMGPTHEPILEHILTEFSSGPVGFCYDSGHENVDRRCFRLLEKFGHRLLVFHLHDNAGHDEHKLPYEGDIDWDQFRRVLPGLHFSGDLLLEVDMARSQFKAPETFLSEALKRAQRLID